MWGREAVPLVIYVGVCKAYQKAPPRAGTAFGYSLYCTKNAALRRRGHYRHFDLACQRNSAPRLNFRPAGNLAERFVRNPRRRRARVASWGKPQNRFAMIRPTLVTESANTVLRDHEITRFRAAANPHRHMWCRPGRGRAVNGFKVAHVVSGA